MIYLKDIRTPQVMCIPKSWREASGTISFNAKNTTAKAEFSFSASLEDTTMLYHKVRVTLPESIPSGEWEYVFSDMVGEISRGLLVIGDKDDAVEYYTITEYEQYTE